MMEVFCEDCGFLKVLNPYEITKTRNEHYECTHPKVAFRGKKYWLSPLRGKIHPGEQNAGNCCEYWGRKGGGCLHPLKRVFWDNKGAMIAVTCKTCDAELGLIAVGDVFGVLDGLVAAGVIEKRYENR